MNIARWVLTHSGVRDALVDDLVDELRYGGTGAQWRRAVLVWAKRHRETLLFTAAISVLYRIGTHIPVPGVNATSMTELRKALGPELFGPSDLVAGGNLTRVTIFALGVLPYIYGSMGVQLAFTVWRALTRRASALATRHVAHATGIAAVGLCALQAYGMASFLEAQSGEVMSLQIVVNPGWPFRLVAVVTLIAGMACLMWLSDYITMRGTANGMLVSFIAGIIAGLPDVVSGIRAQGFPLFLTLALAVAVVAWIARGYRVALQARPV